MYAAVLVLATLTIATANAGLIGAPLATSIVGTRTISLGAPIGLGAPISLGAPIGLGGPLIGKSIIAGPAIAPLGLGLGSPLLGKSILAGPALSTVAVGPALGAGPLLKAW